MTHEDLRFGQLALRMGLMTDEQISLCTRAQAGNPKNKFGSIAVALDILTPDQVLLVLKEQGARLRARGHTTDPLRPPDEPRTATEARSAVVDETTAAVVPGARTVVPGPPLQDMPRMRTVVPGAALLDAPPNAPASAAPVEARPVATLTVAPGPESSTLDPKLVHLLSAARKKGASDLHVMANRKVALRRHGELTQHGEPLSVETVERMLLSVMDPLRRAQLGEAGYSDFAIDVPGAGRLRVNVGTQATGLKGCFRFVMGEPPSLAQLGLPDELEKVLTFHQGLAIVSGPNGMGKTTTLAALVSMINRTKPCHIITVEDPVEVVYPVSRAVVSQREVGVHTKSFARALKAALREDPDVIVIGELRDLETVEIALEAAETGHLVIATMSTRSAAKTIDRLIDMFPPEEQTPVRASLAGGLKIVVSQRLVPTKDGHGMVPVAEVISGGIQLASLIRDNKLLQLPSLMQRGKGLGMLQFDESLFRLVRAGKITAEMAKQYAEHRSSLDTRLTEAGAAPAAVQVPDTWKDEIPPEPDPWAADAKGNLKKSDRKPLEAAVAPWDLLPPVAKDAAKRAGEKKP